MTARKKVAPQLNGKVKKVVPKKPIRAKVERAPSEWYGYSTPPLPVKRAGDPVCLTGDRVVKREIEWIWPKFLPRGLLTLLTGDTGTGKSSFFAALCRAVTRGEPVGNGEALPPSRVLYFGPEEPLDSMIVPRLEANGVDLARVSFGDYAPNQQLLGRMTLPADIRRLSLLTADVGASLVILDPVTSYLANSRDQWDDLAVRALLEGLQGICFERGATVIITRHYRKNRQGGSRDRVHGSATWTQFPRTVLACGLNPDDESERILATSKWSCTDQPSSARYEIKKVGNLPVFELGGESGVKADDLDSPPGNSGDRDALTDACAFLLDYLKNGERPSKDCNRIGEECGISRGTIRRAKVKLGIISEQVSDTSEPHWVWRLADKPLVGSKE